METTAITKGAILNLSSNTDVYERGERYYREGKLLSFTTQTGPAGGSVVRCGVEGNYKNYNVALTLGSDGALQRYNCSCESHSIWRGACKHVVAALFALAEGTHSSGIDASRQSGSALLDALEQAVCEGIDASLALPSGYGSAGVRLVPTLHWDSRGLFFSLSVGTTRLYPLRKIARFLESCRRGEVIAYGAGLSFAHRPGEFDEKSQQLLAFLLEEDALFAEYGREMYNPLRGGHRLFAKERYVPISDRNMDAFFDIYAGDTLAGTGDFCPEVRLYRGSPPLALTVTHRPGGTALKAEYPAFRTRQGRKYYYLILETGLLRLNEADGALVTRLLQTIKNAPNREVFFEAEEEKRFLSFILPRLEAMGVRVDTTGTPPAHPPAPLQARVYLEEAGKDVLARTVFDYGALPGAWRDYTGEYTIQRMLAAAGFVPRGTGGDTCYLRDDDSIYRFFYTKDGILDALRQHAEVFISEALGAKTRRGAHTRMGVRLRGNLLDITVEGTYTAADLLDALACYRERKKYVRLKEGQFIEIDAIAAPLRLLDEMHIKRRDIKENSFIIPAYRALYLEALAENNAFGDTFTRDAAFAKLIQDFAGSADLRFDVPKGLDTVLRGYQKTGYRWLKTLNHYGFGGILADDMGLGKTLQVIALLESERETLALPALVVVPTSLLYNWENEFARFAPQITVQIVNGPAGRRRELLHDTRAMVYITTYDMLKRDVDFYITRKFSYIIADEAQNIKNPATQAAKSLKALKSTTRFALTGTPIENNLTELWSIFDFIMPGYLHSAGRFAKYFEGPIIRDGDKKRATALRKQIAPFILRRIKENVLKELPEKTETLLPAEMYPEQRRLYQAYLLEAIGALDDIMARDALASSRISILAQLTRLRQLCCHPALFIENYDGGSGKFDLTLETIQLALESGHRVLLFSQFTGMLARFRDALDATGKIAYFYLDGATSAHERMDMTTRFNAGEGAVFLISLKAGGTGLNLTGADVVIHYDPWWNPSVMDQASDRAHRFGQQKAVQVFNIVAKDSIEEKIMALQAKKRDLIDAVITEGGSFINTLTAEEVRALFGAPGMV